MLIRSKVAVDDLDDYAAALAEPFAGRERLLVVHLQESCASALVSLVFAHARVGAVLR
jgi:hypothetical protein